MPVEKNYLCTRIFSRGPAEHTSPNVILNEELSTITSVDTIVVVVEDIVEDVTVAETEGRSARVEVEPPIVGVSNSDSYILRSIVVGMTNKRSFPVSIELAISDRDTSAAVGDVEKSIVTGLTSK